VTVLIADDEPTVVELVRVTLEDPQVRVIEASDGETALALADAFAPDLVLLDVAMPGLDGLEVCRELRKSPRPSTPTIVMLTAATQEEDIARGFAAGADEYLTKPFSPLRLISILERFMPAGALWLPRE
jgi:DNA-binding response OmpR family regulator